MKIFALEEHAIKLSSDPGIVGILSSIKFNRRTSLALPENIKLNRLHNLSKRRSATSSNEIEGVKIKKIQDESILINGIESRKPLLNWWKWRHSYHSKRKIQPLLSKIKRPRFGLFSFIYLEYIDSQKENIWKDY